MFTFLIYISLGGQKESYYNLQQKATFLPIPVADFPVYYLKHKDYKNSDLAKQYKSVPSESIHATNEAVKTVNRAKNRYQNITAYDHTRVKLKTFTGNEKSDYINANYIENYHGKISYIASQAPKVSDIYDFWRMILGEKPPAIVMLTNLVENGKSKCTQYWPESGKGSYDGIDVSVYETNAFADYVIRKMEIRYEKQVHTLLHFHFTSWPDHGCPEYPTMLLNFCYRFRQLISYDRSPSVIHCSAGVGRTGTMIVIDTMLHLIKQENIVDIYNYFEAMRQNRSHMVQTLDQYLFIYNAIYEVLCCGDTDISSSVFVKTYKDLMSGKVDGQFKMKLEFEKLNEVTPSLKNEQLSVALKTENKKKNRDQTILPRKYILSCCSAAVRLLITIISISKVIKLSF